MKYVKMLGLLAVAAAALMAFAGTASATTVTDGSTKAYTGNIVAVNESPLVLHGVQDVTCEESIVEGKVEKQGSGVTAEGKISELLFDLCDEHVDVKKAGSLQIHWTSGSNGTLTSTGAEVTVEFTETIFGDVHCVFGTNNTHIGTVTGAPNHTTGRATLHIDSAPIPVVSGSFLCGESAEWTGDYEVVTPTGMTIDQ